MTRRTLDPAHTSQEVNQHFQHHPALVSYRVSGGHTIYTGPTGTVVTTNHPGDIPRGTLRSICKMAVMAGLGALVIGLVIAAAAMVV